MWGLGSRFRHRKTTRIQFACCKRAQMCPVFLEFSHLWQMSPNRPIWLHVAYEQFYIATKPSMNFCMENGDFTINACNCDNCSSPLLQMDFVFYRIFGCWSVTFGYFYDDPMLFARDKHEGKQCEKQDFVNTQISFWNWYAKQITSLSSSEKQETQFSQFVICQMGNVLCHFVILI